MTVRSYGAGGDRRIAINRAVHWLSIAEAIGLRDELTRELGAPQAQAPTDREAMVWAAEFSRAMGIDGVHVTEAVRSAAVAVRALRASREFSHGDSEVEQMLNAMTGDGQ